ncbi:MAG: hypothetical protein NT091_04595 [Candidatus Falkowbacteria bacterium]|nr:hypothetical protein [Candidatus Falkowbacteria bacterium]
MTQEDLQQFKELLRENNIELKTEIVGKVTGLIAEGFANERKHTDEQFVNERKHSDEQFAEVVSAVAEGFANERKHTDEQFANERKHSDEQFAEVVSAVAEGFAGAQEQINECATKEDLVKCATKEDIVEWGDNRIIDLELARDRHDYLHINDLNSLPSQSKINKALIERGFK